MKQPFHYDDGRRAMPGDLVHLHSGADVVPIMSLWFDPDDGTDATLYFERLKDRPMKRVNLATDVRPVAAE